MENQKQKKSVGTILLVILLLIVTIASLILATYAWAKYSSVESGEATAQVAKWNVNVGIKEGTNKMEEKFEHVLAQRLAPGMSGSFEIDIDPGQTEVDFHYDIILDKVEAVGENATVPAHLHFYTNKNHGADDLIGDIEGTGDAETGKENGDSAEKYLSGDVILLSKDGTKLATPTPGSAQPEFEFEGNKIKKVIYWEWPFEDPTTPTPTPDDNSIDTTDGTPTLSPSPNGISDYDDQDTIDGMNAGQVKVSFRVVTTQIKPGNE